MAGHGNNKKDDYCVPGEEIARGLIFLAPGSPPPWCFVSLCHVALRSRLVLVSYTLRNFASNTEIDNENWSYGEIPRCWSIGIFVSCKPVSLLSHGNYYYWTCVEA